MAGKGDGSLRLGVVYDRAGFARSGRQVVGMMGGFSRQMIAQARLVNGALQFGFVFFGTHQLANVNRKFREFDHTLFSISGKIGETRKEMGDLEDTILKVAASSTKTATDVAGAAEKFALLGFGKDDIKRSLQSTIDASVATGTAIEDIAYTAGSVSRAVRRSFDDINDLLVTTATNSGTTIEDMAVGLKYAQASFRGLGLSAEEAFLIIGKLANVGVRGSVMGTAFRSGLAALARDLNNLSDVSSWSDLEKQLSKQQDTLRKHNIIIRKDSKGNILNFKEMLDTMIANEAATADFINILGTRSGSYFAALANTTSKSNEKLEKAIDNYVGTAASVKARMEQSLKSQWLLTLARWEDLQLAISRSGLADAEMSIVKRLQGALIYLKENLSDILPIAIKVGAALGAAGLAMAFRLLGSAVIFMLKPLWRVPMAILAINAATFTTMGGLARLAGRVTALAGAAAAVAVIADAMNTTPERERWERDNRDLKKRRQAALKLEKELKKENDRHQALITQPGIDKRYLRERAPAAKAARDEWLMAKRQREAIEAQLNILSLNEPKTGFETAVDNAVEKYEEMLKKGMEFWNAMEAKGRMDAAKQHLDDLVFHAKNIFTLAYGEMAQEVDDPEFDNVIRRDKALYGEFGRKFRGGYDPHKSKFAKARGEGVPAWKQPWSRDDISNITSAANGISAEAGKVAQAFAGVADGSNDMVSAILTGFDAVGGGSKSLAKAMVRWNTAKAIMAIWGVDFTPETQLPLPAKIGLSAVMAKLGQQQLKAIDNADIGQAHDGLSRVPRTGSYVLEGGEAVIKRDQNAQLQKFLDSQMGQQPMVVQIMPNRKRGGLHLDRTELEDLNKQLTELGNSGKVNVRRAVVA